MKVSWKWLSEIIDLSQTNPNELANYLNIAGLEVDSIYTINNINTIDTILNIIPTTNRNYASNMIGIAQEVAAIFNQELDFNLETSTVSNYTINSQVIRGKFLYYNTYSSILLNNIIVKPSPQWIQSRLKPANIQPVNNIIDIKNYINLKWGHSLEIFVAATDTYINNQINKIILTHPENNIPFALAQITKNLATKPSKNTKSILIESAILLNSNTNKHSNIPEEYAKYRKNLDVNILDLANKETIYLLKKFCNGIIKKQIHCYPKTELVTNIKVFDKNLQRILGLTNNKKQFVNCEVKRITKILLALNFQPVRYNTHWLLTIPQHKNRNITREIDVIEEIARIYGLNLLIDTIPISTTKYVLSKRELIKRKIRHVLRSSGLYELMQSSFAQPTVNNIPIHNFLNEDCSNLRSNLITNLIRSTFYNIQQGNNLLNGFEIGKIFHKKHQFIHEDLHLGAIFGGNNYLRSLWLGKPQPLSWFQAKGVITNMCQNIGIEIKWKKSQKDFPLYHLFHTNRTANLYIGNENIGFFGEINPQLCYTINTKKRIYGFELSLDTLSNSLSNNPLPNSQIESYSKYPYISRDISIIIPKTINFDIILDTIIENNKPFLKSVELLNEYIGNSIPHNKRNLNLRIKYQSSYTTLTNTQIAELEKNTKNTIQKKFDAEICV